MDWKKALEIESMLLDECRSGIDSERELTERELHFYNAYTAMQDLRIYLEKNDSRNGQ